MPSLRNIALINYNEGSNEEEEEEDIEDEEVATYQYNTDIPTFSSYAKKKYYSKKPFTSGPVSFFPPKAHIKKAN